MTKTPKLQKLFRIDTDLEAGLKALAATTHETESTIMRRAIREYLQRVGAIATDRIDTRTGQIVKGKKGVGGRNK